MDNDLQSYRSSIGHFNFNTHSGFFKRHFFRSNNHLVLYILLMLIIRICFQRFVNFCHSIYLELLLQNPVSTFIILLLILLSNDVELNPGPTKEGELSIFHLNTRSMRHKLDYRKHL